MSEGNSIGNARVLAQTSAHPAESYGESVAKTSRRRVQTSGLISRCRCLLSVAFSAARVRPSTHH